MFLPAKRPNGLIKALRRARCYSYRLPTESLHPIGSAYNDPAKSFRVQVVANEWSDATKESIQELIPKNFQELTDWIELGREDYEESIAPETVRDRIDPAWLERVQWFMEDGQIRNKDDPKSQWMRAAQEREYDELGFPAFLDLQEVYIDPAKGRLCLLFSAELDVHFANHGFGIHRTKDGKVEQLIDQVFYDLAEFGEY